MHKNDRSFIYQGKDVRNRKLHARVHVSPLGKPCSGRSQTTFLARGDVAPRFAVSASQSPLRGIVASKRLAASFVQVPDALPTGRPAPRGCETGAASGAGADHVVVDADPLERRRGVEVPQGASWLEPGAHAQPPDRHAKRASMRTPAGTRDARRTLACGKESAKAIGRYSMAVHCMWRLGCAG